MKRLLLPLIMVVTACTADAIDVDCGQGTQVIIDDENFCVFKQSVVIENGFDCPPMMPFLTPADGFSVCGSRGQLPDDLIDRIGQEFPDAEVPIPDNNSANNSANNSTANNLAPTCSVTQDCSVGQVCINGECVPEGSCTSNDTCAQGEFCAFASGTCGADPGVCQSRGDTCIDLFDPVCGCDGQTYSNACYAGLAGVSVEFAGACE